MINKDIIEGQWQQIKGKIKQKWGKLTDDDLTQIDGKKDIVVGKLQEKYGYTREKAEEEWNSLNTSDSDQDKS